MRMGIAFGVVVAGLVAGVLIAPLPASAVESRRSGELSVEVNATFGAPLSVAHGTTVLPFSGFVQFSGVIFGTAGVTGGLATPGVINWLVASSRDENLFPSTGSVEIRCIVRRLQTAGALCHISGEAIGHGDVFLGSFDPQMGGRIAFRIDVLDAFCPLCLPRP